MEETETIIDIHMNIFGEWLYFNQFDSIEKLYKNGIKFINGNIFIVQIYHFHNLYIVCLFDILHNTDYITGYISEYNMERYMCFIAKYCYVCAMLYDIFLIFIGGIDLLKMYSLSQLNELLDCVLRYNKSCIEYIEYNNIINILCDENWLSDTE